MYRKLCYIAIETFLEFDSEYSSSSFVKLTDGKHQSIVSSGACREFNFVQVPVKEAYDWSNHQPDARQGRDAIASAKKAGRTKISS
jgi:hypothetical protein